VRAKANPDHYPAPYRILDLWRADAAQEEEARSLGELLVGRTSRNLVNVFLLAEELKRRGKKHEHHIERVHVVGAGVMGADIAIWAASRGFYVSLQDRNPEILARAVKKAYGFYKKKLKQPRLVQEAMDRLMPDLNGDSLARADLVIEAIIEKVEAKRELFAQVEARVRPEALLASNTSSIRSRRSPSRSKIRHVWSACTSSTRWRRCSWSRSCAVRRVRKRRLTARAALRSRSTACRWM